MDTMQVLPLEQAPLPSYTSRKKVIGVKNVQPPILLTSSHMESYRCAELCSSSPHTSTGVKSPSGYQPIPGNWAFRSLRATPRISKPAVASSQTDEDIKNTDKLQEYVTEVLSRARRMV